MKAGQEVWGKGVLSVQKKRSEARNETKAKSKGGEEKIALQN